MHLQRLDNDAGGESVLGRRAVVFMFSGQGAQYYQMGRALMEADAVYRASFTLCERIVGPIDGRSLTDILFSRALSDSADLDRLRITHPLLVSVGWSLCQALLARGVRPEAVFGYSLGETIAAIVAGAVALEDALPAVCAQAAVFEATAPPGALIAVLAGADTVVGLSGLDGRLHVAAINAANHCVTACAEADAEAVMAVLSRHGMTFQRLPVRFAFHSPGIEETRDKFLETTAGLRWRRPDLPVFSCALGGVVESLDGAHFWSVARGPVRFLDTIRPLLDGDARLVDVGPSGTLAGFVRLIAQRPGAAAMAMSAYGRDVETMRETAEFCR